MKRRTVLGVLGAPLLAGLAGCKLSDLLSPSSQDTSVVGAGGVTLIGAGDHHANKNLTARGQTGAMVKQALDADPTALAFALGDLTHRGGADEIPYYDATWGAFKGRTLFTQGNHDVEYADPAGAAYDAYTGAPKYEARTLGSWRLYSLNCNPSSKDGPDQDAQLAWLAADLEQYSSTYHILALGHYPLFSSVCARHHKAMTWPYRVQPWWALLQQHNAELYLSGHAHRYERFARKLADGTASEAGIRQYVLGTAGVHVNDITQRESGSEAVVVAHGVTRFDLYPDRYEWSFTDTDGTVRDSGTQQCHAL